MAIHGRFRLIIGHVRNKSARCSEVDVYIDKDGKVHVTGGVPQTEVHAIIV